MHLDQGQLFAGWVGGGVSSVDAPSNTIELDMESGDLLLLVDFEEIETLDGDLLATDAGEFPVPDDHVVSSWCDLDVLDAGQAGGVENTGDVVLLAIEGDSTDLDSVSLDFLVMPCRDTHGISSKDVDRVRSFGVTVSDQSLSSLVGGRDVSMGED